ncbi:ROK family protein [Corynebacterium uterequi]|uniref:Transcriptional regulator/sugar kinase n=1 Tax=Corynebacterium uterequi TaxID=1072256 RepID=A0A0G3HBM2_9CORY|nr:ROK family protein [Corynebacterium uterequi]AKK10095.1 transcriptional regulator/sugar kinase [Corynebacterium uterequi]
MYGPAFALPTTPAAKCLYLMRHQPLMTRAELMELSGLSQPTVTRAVTALLQAGLIRQRSDLTRSQGRGRPTIPLQICDTSSMHAGIAVGTHSTYIALFDSFGRTLRKLDLNLPAARMTDDDGIEHYIAGLHRLTTGLARQLTSVGFTFPGHVTDSGVINAPSLGWRDVDIASRLRYQFSVPVTVAAAVPAILGSELQNTNVTFADAPTTTMAFFADDSIGAAVSTGSGVRQLDVTLDEDSILPTYGLLTGTTARSLAELVAQHTDASRALLDRRAQALGELAAEFIAEQRPSTVVVAGSAFLEDPHAPGIFARTVRSQLGSGDDDVELRLIPTHREIVLAIARAVALERVLQDPLHLIPTYP